MTNTANTPKPVKPTLIGTEHITRALGDANFFTLLPEFLPAKRRMESVMAAPGPGCASCRRRRAVGSATSDFISILSTLSDDGLARMKKYLGVQKLLVRSVNKTTGKVEMKEA
jgi:hypothetical protein